MGLRTRRAIRRGSAANGIETLVLAGIATSGVVRSTVRRAAGADYRLVIVEDCCADRDAEVHWVLMEKVVARWTTVRQAADVVARADPALPLPASTKVEAAIAELGDVNADLAAASARVITPGGRAPGAWTWGIISRFY